MWVSRFSNHLPKRLAATDSNRNDFSPEQLHRFGFWLNFDPAIEAQYEADSGENRVAHARWATYIGLIFYNAYNVTDVILHHDILILSWVMRTLVVTPVALVLATLIGNMSAQLRERLGMLGMINAIAIPIFLFYWSSDPLSLYSLVEIPVVLVFGCLTLVLRFPHAVIFTVSTFLMSLLAIMMRHGLSPNLQFVFSFQILSVSAFVLIGNYKIEAVRRGVYLQELRERVRSKSLENDRQTLTALSNTDFLTGVGNRRYFDEVFLAIRQDKGMLTLLMIDVDFFKQFNDTYGHPMGDSCLCMVVGALKSELRPGSDVLARFGGEEFVVILSDVPNKKAQDIADRLRVAVQAAAIPHATRPDGLGVVTISIGATFVDAGGTETPQEILHLADLALYDAKHRGRNRSVIRKAGANGLSNVA